MKSENLLPERHWRTKLIRNLFAYPCRSSGIVSSIKAMLSRLNPPVLKLIPPDDRLLKFPPSVRPWRSSVPNGFFIFTDFVSFRFSVKFWRNSPPPARGKTSRRAKNLIHFLFSIYQIEWKVLAVERRTHLPAHKGAKLQTNFINI